MLTKKFKAESAARKTAVAEKVSMEQKLAALQGDMQAKISTIEHERDSAIADAKVKHSFRALICTAAGRAAERSIGIRSASWYFFLCIDNGCPSKCDLPWVPDKVYVSYGSRPIKNAHGSAMRN